MVSERLPIPAEIVEAAAVAMWGGEDWEAAGRCYPWDPGMPDCQEALAQVELGFRAAEDKASEGER
jgi:hypothetical protein